MASEIKERNALAELADELVGCANILLEEGWVGCEREVLKAQRIIAELAKVKDEDEYRMPYDYKRACRDAYENCRAIAEE